MKILIPKGVMIGRCSSVAAGAVVNRNVPAKVIKRRFDPDTILRHEALLYPKE
jgi:acetyltransferase-like isoleucine patch superfamily enzyme